MAGFTVAKFKDVSDGLQGGQFAVGERKKAQTLADLWMSIKATVVNEIREGEPGGERAAEHIDRMWTKYTGQEPPYGLRDPVIDEKRVLFECRVDRVATFGKP